ncbi:MAG: KEOPS complex subunit Pcc1 [Candidatus Bathyarchaeia archaeon]
MPSAIITVSIDSATKAEKIFAALTPESKATERFRSHVTIKKRGKTVILHFRAPDVTSLRASVNSYCRWTWLLNKTLEVLDSEN